jgi:hypothetical protein
MQNGSQRRHMHPLKLFCQLPKPFALLLAAYAALGFDGLGHYAVAPMAHHTLGANITILSEVAAADLLLPASLYLLASRMRSSQDHANRA